MKSLLLKQYYLGKVFFLFQILFIFLIGIISSYLQDLTAFMIFCSINGSLLSIGIMNNNDINCDWFRYENMLPISTKDLVLSKYIFGYLCCLVNFILLFIVISALDVKLVPALIFYTIIFSNIQNLFLPLYFLFKFSSQQNVIYTILIVITYVKIGDYSLFSINSFFYNNIVLLIIVTIILNIISIKLSCKFHLIKK